MNCKKCHRELTEVKTYYKSQGRLVEQPTGDFQCLNNKCSNFGLKLKEE